MRPLALFPLLSLAAAASMYSDYGSAPVLKADGLQPLKREPEPKFDNERIAEAEARRERKAAKRAANLAKSKANNYK